MSKPFIPRDYQVEAVNALWSAFAETQRIDPLVCLPTGTGKASLLGMIIHDIYYNWPDTGTVIVLTHVKELVVNDAKSIKWVWPNARLSVYSNGAGSKDLSGQVIVAGIQSFIAVADLIKNPCVVLVDEAHMIPTDAESTYRKCIDILRKKNPKMVVIGLTATPFRSKGGMLIDHGLFNHIAYDATQAERFVKFIDDGYLAPIVPKATNTSVSDEGIRITAGEYNLGDMQELFDQDHLTRACVKEIVESGRNRKKWLIFASGIEHAEHVAAMLRAFGIPTGCVHSKMEGDRDDELAKFEAGEYRAMVNNGILTTGYDCPGIDLIAMLRITRSNVLWIQMLGRGTRPLFAPGFDITTKAGRLAAIAASDKQNCLVLDFGNNTLRLGPINDPQLPDKKKKGGGPAIMKTCPKCKSYNYARVINCTGINEEEEQCDYIFPDPELKIDTTASGHELITKTDSTPIIEVLPVDFTTYSLYSRPGKPSSIKVIYTVGLRHFSQWVNIEHQGTARGVATDWWTNATLPSSIRPESCAEFLSRKAEIVQPSHIRVWMKKGPRGGKGFPTILKVLYDGVTEDGTPIDEPAIA